MSEQPGPGVKSFWILVERGEEPDLADLARRFPKETLALAEAMLAHTQLKSAARRERMWSVRNRVLASQGEAVSLGALLKEKRRAAGLKVEEVARRLSGMGQRIAPDALRGLEEGRLSPLAVRAPVLWPRIAAALSIDPGQLMAFIEGALQGPKTVQQFTRMARGAAEEDREGFMESLGAEDAGQTEHYLEEVRQALGLPRRKGNLR